MRYRNIVITLAYALVVLLMAGCAFTANDIVDETASPNNALLDVSDLFTDRDLEQTASLSDAVYYTVSDGGELRITEEGVYVLRGMAANFTVYVEAGDPDKVQLVLDGVTITNDSLPCIYVTEADKVFLTTSEDSSLSVTGAFASGNAVVFSSSDLVLNGAAKLTISSTENGVTCKDDLKITGGSYAVAAADVAFRANDSIRIADGSFRLAAGSDGFHAENSKDDTLGYIYIGGGDFELSVGDDAIHALSLVEIDGGTFAISAAEGIEGTYVLINGGTLGIGATGDGINGAQKSDAYYATVEICGGDITIVMASGDTDGVDSNGDLIVRGGTIDVTASSAFDYDGTATYTGGAVIVNGEQVDSIPEPG